MKRHFTSILFVLIAVLLLFKAGADADFGWHYRYGEYFVKTHTILKDNVFSYNYTDYKWANSYWISQIIIYITYSAVGPVLMSLLFASVIGILWVLLINKIFKDSSFYSKLFASLIFFQLLSYANVTWRPLYFSTILMLLLIYTLLYKRHLIKFLPLLFLVWANTHADFTLGLFVFGTYIFFSSVESATNRTLKPKTLGVLLGILLVCVVTTLINPYGLTLWETLLKETHYFQFNHISEWMPVNHGKVSALSVIVMGVVFFMSLILPAISLRLDKSKPKIYGLWYFLAIVVFCTLSLRSIYFIRVLITLSIFSFIYVFDYAIKKLKDLINLNSVFIKKELFVIKFFTVFFVLLICGKLFSDNVKILFSKDLYCTNEVIPCGAVSYIKQNKPKGNMLNSYNWGGYLILELPEYKTFVDGRMPSWRTKDSYLFSDYIDIVDNNNYELFSKYSEKYNIKWILGYKEAKFIEYMIKEHGWKEVYSDSISRIIVE